MRISECSNRALANMQLNADLLGLLVINEIDCGLPITSVGNRALPPAINVSKLHIADIFGGIMNTD